MPQPESEQSHQNRTRTNSRTLTDWIRFGTVALLAYVLLTIPWPGLRSNYVHAFEKGSEQMVNSLGWEDQVRFRARPGESARYDSRIILGDLPAKKQLLIQPCDAWSMGYRPLAILLSLVIATRMKLKRKLARLFPALLLLAIYVALRLSIVISQGWNARESSLELAGHADQLGTFLPPIISSALFYSLHHSPMCYLIPAAIWALWYWRESQPTATA